MNYKEIKNKNRNNPNFNRKKIMQAVELFLEAIGENKKREGLQKTPDRVARMCEEVFEGNLYSNEEIAKMFNVCFQEDSKDLVIIKDIDVNSFCEHHLALMYDMKISVGYIPSGKVIGLSKVARICDLVCKRLQLQERIANDVVEILSKVLSTENIIVSIKGKHSCMTSRGIKKNNSITKTVAFRGKFKQDSKLRNEFYNLI